MTNIYTKKALIKGQLPIFIKLFSKEVSKTRNIDIKAAIEMASKNPVVNLGVYKRKGSIEVGKDADLVILDKNSNILMTIIKGNIIY